MNEKCEIYYFWYHHMFFSYDEIQFIEKIICEGDYDFFQELRRQYGEFCFPKTATLTVDGEIVGEIYVDKPQGFALITYNECECG